MTEVFVDTSGWANYFLRRQPYHRQTVDFLNNWQRSSVETVTTNYVVAELASLLTSPLKVERSLQIQMIETLRSSAWVTVVHIDPAMEAEAWDVFKRHRDKSWSLVDCTSFAIMRSRGISQALTEDHHFDQAGFQRLL